GVVWILFVAGSILLYRRYLHHEPEPYDFTLKTRALALLAFVLLSGLLFLGARGIGVKPVRIITAARYTQPLNIPLLINTPFSIFHTLKKRTVDSRSYFSDAELSGLYTPEHAYSRSRAPRKDNVVIIILESFSKEFIGALNNGKGYTPNFDRIIRD